MKLILVCAAIAFTFAVNASDATVKISDVHLCCGKCVTGVEKAVSRVEGANASVDKEAGTVTITAPDSGKLQKAADALVEAGYFGTSSDASVKMNDVTGAKGKQVKSLNVTGLHLCCDKCAKTADKAVKSVPGVTGDTAAKGVSSFEVTGDFNDKDVFLALQKAGLTGKAAE
jgi:copper chaperone CopZ